MEDLKKLVGNDSIIILNKTKYELKEGTVGITLFSNYSQNKDEDIYLLLVKIFKYNEIPLNLIDDLTIPQTNLIFTACFKNIEVSKKPKKKTKKKKSNTGTSLNIAFFMQYFNMSYQSVMDMPYSAFLEMNEQIGVINKLKEGKTLKEIEDSKKTSPDLKGFKEYT